VMRKGSITRETSCELSELRTWSEWSVCSSKGVHVRGGFDWFEAVISALLICFANELVECIV
jgi:hypothetical protein